MDERERRIETNEKLFREVNDRVETLNQSLGVAGYSEWICECGDSTCFERLTVALQDYRRIREHGDRFIVKLGHEAPDVEVVVEQGEGYAVVEKFAPVT